MVEHTHPNNDGWVAEYDTNQAAKIYFLFDILLEEIQDFPLTVMMIYIDYYNRKQGYFKNKINV